MPVVRIKSSFVSRFLPAPDFLTLDPVGLDISPEAVRIMKFRKIKAGNVPHIYDEIILNSPCTLLEQESDLETCDELRASIIKLRDTYNLHYVTVSLPEFKTYIFKTKLPIESLKTIEETLKFKLEEYVPLSPEDVVFQYSILEPRKGVAHEGHIDVVVSTLPKTVIEMYTQLLHELELEPISFESESHSLARSLVKKNDQSSYLLIHFGATKVNLSIVERGSVQYASSFSAESKEIVADFAGEQAQSLKKQINKLLVYWFTNKSDMESDHKIEVAILSGSVAMTPGLVDFLERGLHLSVNTGVVWQNAFSIDDHIPPINHDKSLDYAVAIGLALLNKE